MVKRNSASANIFESLLDDAINSYPNLKIISQNQDVPFLRGVLDIHNDIKEVVGHFLIEIHCSSIFPFRFPLLFEIGGDIPIEANWHRNYDGSCCITVWPDELEKCKSGITIANYIKEFAIPYFANQIFRKQMGFYKNGEYAHNKPGIFQYYFGLNQEQLKLN